MKFFSVLNVFWMFAAATVSAGQYTPDFTGAHNTDSNGFFAALRAAPPAGLPAVVPAEAAAPGKDFTAGYNPGQYFPGPPSLLDGAGEKNVFTSDARVKVTNTKYPWSAIGRLDVPGGVCTASLVGADIILTNRHCIVDKATNKLKEGSIIFRPGYTNGKSAHASGVTFAWWGSTTTSGGDWAILRLETALGKTYGWLGSRDTSLNSGKLYAVGYSGDFEDSASAACEPGCRFTGGVYSYGLAPHNCSNSRGASGGPMFIFEGESPVIIAIHTGELRYEGDSTYHAVEFSDKNANLGLPASAFTWKIAELSKPKQ